mgnify:CR=1 FL=1
MFLLLRSLYDTPQVRRPDWELPELHAGLQLAPADVLWDNKRSTCAKWCVPGDRGSVTPKPIVLGAAAGGGGLGWGGGGGGGGAARDAMAGGGKGADCSSRPGAWLPCSPSPRQHVLLHTQFVPPTPILIPLLAALHCSGRSRAHYCYGGWQCAGLHRSLVDWMS